MSATAQRSMTGDISISRTTRAAPRPSPTTPARMCRSATDACPAELFGQRVQDRIQGWIGVAGRLLRERRRADHAMHVGGAIKHARREPEALEGARDLLELADHALRSTRLVDDVVDQCLRHHVRTLAELAGQRVAQAQNP